MSQEGGVLQAMFTGQRVASPAMGTAPLEATVIEATATAIIVTIDGFSTTATYQCRYAPEYRWNGSANEPVIPDAGAKCLIAFPTNSTTNTPWVLAVT